MSDSTKPAEEGKNNEVHECIECGKTVIVHRNPFKKTRWKDSVHCTCTTSGTPMVKREVEDDPDDDDELLEGLKAAGAAMSRWEKQPTRPTPGSCKLFCHDCGHEKVFWDQGGIDAKTRAGRAKAGHRNKGCSNIEVLDNS